MFVPDEQEFHPLKTNKRGNSGPVVAAADSSTCSLGFVIGLLRNVLVLQGYCTAHSGTDKSRYLECKYLYIIYYVEFMKCEEIRVYTMYSHSVLIIRILI